MPAWLAFSLLSALAAALAAIFGKIGVTKIDANVATFVRALVMLLFMGGVVAAQGKLRHVAQFAGDRRALAFVVLSGVAGATSWLFYFMALKHGKVAQVAPIDKLSVVLAAILAIVILHEKISLLNGAGVALIATGAICVALG